ncbi:hypothetical protein BGW36DRAFT_293355 [Talaromyces proteolyticus]|uniref:Atos-like conserved domain-containing protein n=1 Tax=Talaromyces proteolyticus TaxID=1131652 RepID=A0AAD4KSM4_9EURO|nr:uncharacterized protein BGW36DRAFT_293355 [Talaromyces proteolyticus]KAH8698423.1 hypothetical protein BGW36DRAFT_293355 [Talaromyces proteolyticus]
MPIFQDPDKVISSFTNSSGRPPSNENEDSVQKAPWSQQWRDSESADVEMSGTSPTYYQAKDYESTQLPAHRRDELIQSIKREQNPSWISQFASERYPFQQSLPQPFGVQNDVAYSPSLTSARDVSSPNEKGSLAPSPEIERPRSALHSGDFREGSQDRGSERPSNQRLDNLPYEHTSTQPFSTSPTTPWYLHSFSIHSHFRDPETSPLAGRINNSDSRSRAPSLGSLSSSYVLKAPTSPLVYQANNADLDFSLKPEFADSPSHLEKSNRRRTLPPEIFRQIRGSPPVQSQGIGFSKSFASMQREENLPSQAHQPRRSSTYSLQLASSPQTTFRHRRPSLASDLSPRIHASMVGSYEESILRGRMSTSPSKPLDFTAQIGVLGRGKCKSNLKCPPHITVPFPAVFYSYPTSGTGRSISDDSPSPYVGLIDLENSLTQDKSGEERRNRRRTSPSTESKDSSTRSHSPKSTASDNPRKREKRSRSSRSDALKTPPGVFYRIPQRGQLQIVIKNPNKTAVKLFLVPYDLDDMEPGSKTFIRQRSYSAGPIIDMPLTARKNFGTDRPEASLNSTDDPKDKPMLRYLIHLNICCTAKGRFYLYSTIRVVFANRVPDGKEKLRNEIQYPEPRYSPYRPVKDLSHTKHRSAIDKPYRRLSAGIGFTASHFHQDHHHAHSPYPHHSPPASSLSATAGRISTLPFKLSTPKPRHTPAPDSSSSIAFGNLWQPVPAEPFQKMAESPPSSRIGSSTSQSPQEMQIDKDTNKTENNEINNTELYSKLKKGDAGYGGGYPESAECGGSLLAKKLKDWTCKSQESSPGR